MPALEGVTGAVGGGKTIIRELHGLRGLAVLGIVLGAVAGQALANMHLHRFGISLTPFFLAGGHGINLAFILSAFVLFLPYAAGDRDIGAPGAWRGFYRRRAMRLLPAYYLIVVVQMSFQGRLAFGGAGLARETLSLLSFTFPFMPDLWMPSSVNESLWAVGTLVLFSAAFPLLCGLCQRFGATRVLAAAIPAGLLFRWWGFHLGGAGPVNWMEGMLVGRIDEFLWGFFLAEAFVRRRIPGRPYLFWILGVTVLVPVLTAYSWIADGRLPRLLLVPLVDATDVAMVLLVAAALAGRSAWSAFLDMRWLRVVGMACYSLYLWHYPALAAFQLRTDPWNGLNLAGYFAFVFALSALSYRFVEFRGVADWRSLFLIDRPRRPIAAMTASPGG
jgi:peptidoglycan/LPS O-acetylase OafA/YrhL